MDVTNVIINIVNEITSLLTGRLFFLLGWCNTISAKLTNIITKSIKSIIALHRYGFYQPSYLLTPSKPAPQEQILPCCRNSACLFLFLHRYSLTQSSSPNYMDVLKQPVVRWLHRASKLFPFFFIYHNQLLLGGIKINR